MTGLGRNSMGIGDRFGRQAGAQLDALIRMKALGVEVTPVWNKSHREHSIIGSAPRDTREAADRAVREKGWTGAYFVDADHVGMKTVDAFIDSCDFFTLDVADFIGRAADDAALDGFVRRNRRFDGVISIPGIGAPLETDGSRIRDIAAKYLYAVREAGRLYRDIASKRANRPFAVEMSMDETDRPQTPMELLFILSAAAEEKIPLDTLAPKFTGRFNKGVDYSGDTARFAREYDEDLAVLAFAAKEFGLSPRLKLSVHSGSDKFALYESIRLSLRRHGAGLHLKTAGTTWLEEVTGLAESGGEGLALARLIYHGAFSRYDELCRPYATVIDIDRTRLPSPATVEAWDPGTFAAALRHDGSDGRYNPHFRQLIHVGYKVAAELGPRFLSGLDACRGVIARNVADNLFERHLRPLFLDPDAGSGAPGAAGPDAAARRAPKQAGA